MQIYVMNECKILKIIVNKNLNRRDLWNLEDGNALHLLEQSLWFQWRYINVRLRLFKGKVASLLIFSHSLVTFCVSQTPGVFMRQLPVCSVLADTFVVARDACLIVRMRIGCSCMIDSSRHKSEAPCALLVTLLFTRRYTSTIYHFQMAVGLPLHGLGNGLENHRSTC